MKGHKPHRIAIGCVYVIRAVGTNLYKIGLCESDVEDRLKHYATHCPYPISLVCSVKCQSCWNLEREMHERMMQHHSHGEWFAFTDDELAEAVSFLKALARQMNKHEDELRAQIRPRGPATGKKRPPRLKAVVISSQVARLLKRQCRKTGMTPVAFMERAILSAAGAAMQEPSK